ncbi:MAG TPA: hypothetical protein VMS98_10010, partial [Thermoanaerobaculia bacterium]|nr:hypothetical protein [Thermoanaerobaculia bacterium]
MRHTLIALTLFAPLPAAAQLEPLHCGTGHEVTETVREASAWSRARAEQLASKGLRPATAALQDNVVILPADETNAPFRRPFDLHGRTLIFTPSGDGYAVRNTAIAYDTDRGSRLQLVDAAEDYATVTADFEFPFFGRVVRNLFVTNHSAIFLERPQPSSLRQYSDLDLAMESGGVISPLLSTGRSRLTARPVVMVRKSSDSVVITWTSEERYDVQAVLSKSGEIRFSYMLVTQYPTASAIVITSGLESWRNERTALGSASDPSGDIRTGVPASTDLTEMAVSRVSDLDLYEVRLRLRGDVPAQPQGTAGYVLAIGDGEATQTVRLTIARDGTMTYRLPGGIVATGTKAVTVEGSTVTLRFLGEHVPSSGSIPIRAYTTWNGGVIDLGPQVEVPIRTSGRRVRTDFSTVVDEVIERRPIAEAFTLPVLSVARVWEQVKQSLPLTDGEIDGVAIYQNFLTDLVLYAGAYSTGGNAGVSGLYQGDVTAAAEPRVPALMHMNAVGYGHNRTPRGASHVVLHELGHRWLLFVTLQENGAMTRSLNPVSPHPAQYVDTRAAFRVYTDTDTSVMGGGHFTTEPDGAFATGPYGAYGFSWLDLYLMGLADPAEVKPWFYIADSSPTLAGEYYAPP